MEQLAQEPIASQYQASNTFTVSITRKVAPDSRYISNCYLDSPTPNQTIRRKGFMLSGWVIGRSAPVTSIELVSFDSIIASTLASTPVRLYRPDVKAAFSSELYGEHSGFSLITNLPILKSSRLLVVARFTSGHSEILFEIDLTPSPDQENADDADGSDDLISMHDTSQHGEVFEVHKLIHPDFPRYLVDVGAHDGTCLSNSNPFVRAGWTALLLEPVPRVYDRLVETFASYPKAICLNQACSNYTGEGELFAGADGDLGQNSTLCTDNNSWFDSHRTNKRIPVKVTTLTKLLTEQKFPSDFSLLFIDTEGMDFEVLEGLNFNLYSPRVILTEEYPQNVEKHKAKYDLLRMNGYKFVKLIGCNSLWLRQDLA